ncbi:hypothetical protein ACFONG_03435 [Uliginosibacterium paludis]|uniref:Uncharacterized protein n=1 Tax=Uliginosibacterium paludis TaxID=1615952 RepID=A0ABV2CNU1_9RHOO
MRKFITALSPDFFAVSSIVLFALSLAMPAFRFSEDEVWFKFSSGNDLWPGFLVLILGWIGVFQGVFAWLSNPLWAIGMLFYAKKRFSRAFQFFVAAFLFALSVYFLKKIAINEGGGEGAIYSMGLGYYTWLASIISILAGSIRNLTRRSSGTPPLRGSAP